MEGYEGCAPDLPADVFASTETSPDTVQENSEVPDQFDGGLKCRLGVSEIETVADDSVVAKEIGEHPRRFRNDTPGGPMRGRHRHAYAADS